MKPIIVVHGGAGVISKDTPPAKTELYIAGVKEALDTGFQILEKGGTALDATMRAVIDFENNSLFNAGKGAVYTSAATHEMDAAIMDGKNLNFGAVSNVCQVKNPVLLARKVMDASSHNFLAGRGAELFALQHGFQLVEKSYFDDEYRFEQLLKARREGIVARDHDVHVQAPGAKPKGTVGAVALDSSGNLAAATSTGGTTNKIPGRVGDTPVPGAGTFADNRTCAVSCTGYGEELMKKVAAYDLHSRMIYKGLALEEAAMEVVNEHLEHDSGGLIAVDKEGRFALCFNTVGMFRGYKTAKGYGEVKIWE